MKSSIITITYNRSDLIRKAIQSVIDQTYTNFEHIIIDDGSTDDTERVVMEFNDPRIKYFKYQKQPLRSYLRNEGFRKASGDIISLLDSDDIWMNNKLEMVVSAFNSNPTADFVFHNLAFIKGTQLTGKVVTGIQTGFLPNIFSELLNNKVQPYPIFTIRKNILDKVGLLDETMVDGEQDMYFRVASKYNMYYIDQVLILMRKHDGNVTKTTDVKHYEDYFHAIEKLSLQGLITTSIQNNSNCRIYYYKGEVYKLKNDKVKASENFKKSFRSNPFSRFGIRSLINYLRLAL